ncbi:MAG: Uma2 family endonuclease [Hyphomicrobiaceae bacterium]|nr:Uma2 family endonuclease [Hyphomicrobiaceae bacterium]
MDTQTFLGWVETQAAGRYELVRGVVVAMAPERAGHNLVKLAVARELGDAVARAGVPCVVFTDGMSLVIDSETVREPDAAVQCSGRVDPNSTQLADPVIVVEVVSPSSERDDTVDKLVEYFSVASIAHYLIVRPDRGLVIHHARVEPGKIATAIVGDGEIRLEPPGLRIAVPRLLGRL